MSRAIPDYDTDNRLAARLILDQAERYGGEGSLLARWARLWTARHGTAAARDERQPETVQASFDWREAA